MIANKEWFTAQELAGLPGFPKDKSGINRRANKEGWLRRQRANVKGVAYEFHISALPPTVQEALGCTATNELNQIDTEVLTKVIESIEIILASKRKKISHHDKAKIIAMLYKVCTKTNAVDQEIVSNIIELVA